MNQIEIQVAVKSKTAPDPQQIKSWINSALEDLNQKSEIVIRIVDEIESSSLNEQYRHKKGATNVLSFPFEMPEGVTDFDVNLLGDVVICAPVVEREAYEQHKNINDHWAHLVVHGVLHLLGYGHTDDQEAELMENKEIAILDKLNIDNPYLMRHDLNE